LYLILIFLSIQLTPSFGQTGSDHTIQIKTLNKNRIPVDLEDCIKELDKVFSDSSRWITAMTETDFSATMHLGLGMWMRNNRKLWKGSQLSKYFSGKGIYHPDNMSDIILASYYRHLKGQDIKLDEQIKYYQKYWE